MSSNSAEPALTFHLTGQLTAGAEFRGWMARHARKLGVSFVVERASAREMQVAAQGAPEMVEAFALACSLGPKGVYIDTLAMETAAPFRTND
ncbi:MAG: acylphosphatase [Pseudomonadota bacterium]